jgi:hypothetical protein
MMIFLIAVHFSRKKNFRDHIGLLRDYWVTGFVQMQCKIFLYNLRKHERKHSL